MEGFARELSRQLAERNWHSVLCYECQPTEDVLRYLQLPNVTIELLPGSASTNWNTFRELRRILRSHRPSILHLHFAGFITPYPWLARLSGVRQVYFTDHGSRPAMYTPRRAPAWKRYATRLINAPVRRIFCISNYTYQCHATLDVLPVERYQIIYNGSDFELYSDETEPDPGLRAEYGIPDGHSIVLQVSWIIPEKGIPDLIEAARLIVARRPDTHFIFVGEGAYREQYARMAADFGLEKHITWTGRIPGSIGPFFRAADIVCQVSRWNEGFGATISEAMLHAKPVIGTQAGGIPEVIADGQSGFVVPVSSPAVIAEKLLLLLSDPELRQRMGRAGRLIAESKFNVVQNVARLLEVYDLR